MSAEKELKEPGALSEEADRKLWFDLLSKLNDRNLQRARESGATTWVLLGAAIAIIYRDTPMLPSILSSRAELVAASVVFVLLFDVLATLSVALGHVVRYVQGQRETRLLTDLSRRGTKVLFVVVFGVFFVISVLHVWLAARIATDAVTKVTLAVFGVLYALNILFTIAKRIRTVWVARRLKAAVPEFDDVSFHPDLGASVGCFFLLLGAVPIWALLRYLKVLSHSPAGLLLPLGAASHFLTLLVVCFALFARALLSPGRGAFLALETAIVVEGLRPPDIKSRFVTQLLGPSAADWLRRVSDRAKAADARLSETVAGIQPRLLDVEAISADYVMERVGRAGLIVDELTAASQEHSAELDACIFQLKEYARFPMSSNEREIFLGILEGLTAAIEDHKEQPSSLSGTLERIKILAFPPERHE